VAANITKSQQRNLPPPLTREDFVHLHNHTQYSLLDGLTRIPELMDFVQAQGMRAIAMTDHGTLSGAIEFYTEAKARELKALIGIETYVASRNHTDKDPQKDKNRYHLILLASNEIGYKNLMRLSTIANLEGFYYYPRVDRSLLEKYNEGLIVLSGCMGSELGSALKQDQAKLARSIAKWYARVFPGRYYLELQDHGHPDHPMKSNEQQKVNEGIIALSKELDLPMVVTCDAHYLRHEDQDAHEVLLCVGTGSYLSDEKRMTLRDYPLHVTPPQEIIERWSVDFPDAISNTRVIADQCNLELDLGDILIPKFTVPQGFSEKTYLRRLVAQGLVARYLDYREANIEELKEREAMDLLPEQVRSRAEYELGVIDQMGFNGYFLIIWDFISWGKKQGIVFGPGRGSAAGSIIAYALRITELDPLKYDLLFERFLNPDRISMPDIDIDIQDSRREEVIQYCIDRYGKDRVANIVTFGRMFARNAVRDVARVLQVPYANADRLAKMIPPPVQGRHTPLKDSLKNVPELAQEYNSNEESKQVFDLAMQLEGTVRNHGVHAAGVVIAPSDIVDYTPLEMAQKGVVSTQYPMNHIEELGLLKMDFLGLSNLTIIKNTLRIIKKVHDKEVDIGQLPLDDSKTYELLGRGDTTGVFQLESAGMKRYLKQLRPSVFEDIVAMVALYRPGPMQFIDDFINRKHGKKEITYFHPKMKSALENTYGVLVYQEQVMQISKDMCGFSGGQADTLRKGIAKKIPEVLAKMKVEFIEGAITHADASRTDMEAFWKQLEDFAAYCFNKSHAACYAMIAYWTAYLKARYPAAFMAALMTSDYDDIDRLAIEITECQHMALEVLPPDINESFHEFAVVPGKNQIRFGMDAIKNVGSGAVEEIIRARSSGGHFQDIDDFIKRVNTSVVNKKTLESLIKSGALDRFGQRQQLLLNIDILLAYAARLRKEAAAGQVDLFGESSDHTKPSLTLDIKSDEPINIHEQLLWERELLGIYLSHHPLEPYATYLAEQTHPIAKIKPEFDKKRIIVGGLVESLREITTKNGQKMAFVKIADMNDEIELVLFPGAYQKTVGFWQQDTVVVASGKVNSTDKDGNNSEEVKVIVDDARVVTLQQAQAYQSTGKEQRFPKVSSGAHGSGRSQDSKHQTKKQPERLYIRLQNSENSELLKKIKQNLDENEGDTEVVFVIGDQDSKQAIRLPQKVSVNDHIQHALINLVGESNIKVS
jgi:DNA polymerase III subunit alpha